MSGDHDHDHDHHPEPEPYAALRTRALESLLVEKGLVTTDAIDEIVRMYEQDIGPLNGAKVVARAWVDLEYKRRLLENGTEAIAELGFGGAEGAEIVVLESTPRCTTWSCARSARAIRGRCSACLQPGTRTRHTDPASYWSLARCCGSLD